jgi:Holliday junction resolvasome RuvABC ATP-dependent DNA helicase subunit
MLTRKRSAGPILSQAFSESLAALVRCFEPAFSEGYWRYGQTLDEPISSFALHLFSKLVMADGALALWEYNNFREYFGYDCSLEEASALLQWKASQAPRLLREMPSFLTTIARYDQLHGTAYSAEAVDEVQRLGEVIIAGGEDVRQHELRILEEYVTTLRQQLASAGLGQLGVEHMARKKHGVMPSAKETIEQATEDLKFAIAELQALVGLEAVKQEVENLVNLLRVRQLRAMSGLPNADITLHMVFSGNPGTGKTSVARILAKLYKSMGVLPAGGLVETDRSGLVAGYVGQTALRVRDVVSRALGGVLFIDEAYALSSETSQGDYGHEAIETLLKLMEDHRDNLVVIVAGYTAKMEQFLSSNPGLRSRFNRFVEFPDYSPRELHEIFLRMAEGAHYSVSSEASKVAEEYFTGVMKQPALQFGNARFVRNFFENALIAQSNRLAKIIAPERDELSLILPQDLPHHHHQPEM